MTRPPKDQSLSIYCKSSSCTEGKRGGVHQYNPQSCPLDGCPHHTKTWTDMTGEYVCTICRQPVEDS